MTAPAVLQLNVDYTDSDFDGLRARLTQLIQSVFPTWTDHAVTNFGNILLDLFSFVGDVLCFYQDNQSREARITTARQRKSLIGLAKLIGYAPSGASAATVDETFTLAAPVQAGATLTIPKGDRVKTAHVTSPTFYQLLEDLVFLEGESSKTVSVENSVFSESVLTSTGLANQTFQLPLSPYIDSSAVVTFGNGLYSRVDNFLASTSADRHYVEVVDQNDRAALRFGNGVNGQIPIGNGTVEYKAGGGSSGRVEAGKLSLLERSTYYDSLGAVVRVGVTNALASAGGEDRETNAQIAVNAPESLRVLVRSVAREDYEIVAEAVDGVERALMLFNDEDPGVGENEGLLLLVPVGGGAPSGALIAEVESQFLSTGAKPKPNTLHLTVQGAAYLDIDIDAVIYVAKGFTPAQAAANVRTALADFFAMTAADGTPNPRINFGYYFQDVDGIPTGEFAWSDIQNVVRDTSGVRKVDAGASGFLLNGARADVLLGVREFPRLGEITLRDGDTGLLL